jgi:urease
LYGSFLPIPPDSAFPPHDPSEYAPQKQPGAIILHKSDEHNGRITINKGRQRVKIRVTNNGDRPIQVGSHYHFLETNPHLSFDRGLAYAKRLDIPAGTAVRFEPGDTKSISLVPISGRKFISGGNDLSCGRYNDSLLPSIIEKIIQQEFAYVPEPSALVLSTDTEVERETYVSMYGPTTGDRIRLGDTELWVEIEWDEGASVYGEEAKFGGGKTIREGMAQATNRSSEEVMDLVLTNAVIIDWQGIYKARDLLFL